MISLEQVVECAPCLDHLWQVAVAVVVMVVVVVAVVVAVVVMVAVVVSDSGRIGGRGSGVWLYSACGELMLMLRVGGGLLGNCLGIGPSRSPHVLDVLVRSLQVQPNKS